MKITIFVQQKREGEGEGGPPLNPRLILIMRVAAPLSNTASAKSDRVVFTS